MNVHHGPPKVASVVTQLVTHPLVDSRIQLPGIVLTVVTTTPSWKGTRRRPLAPGPAGMTRLRVGGALPAFEAGGGGRELGRPSRGPVGSWPFKAFLPMGAEAALGEGLDSEQTEEPRLRGGHILHPSSALFSLFLFSSSSCSSSLHPNVGPRLATCRRGTEGFAARGWGPARHADAPSLPPSRPRPGDGAETDHGEESDEVGQHDAVAFLGQDEVGVAAVALPAVRRPAG